MTIVAKKQTEMPFQTTHLSPASEVAFRPRFMRGLAFLLKFNIQHDLQKMSITFSQSPLAFSCRTSSLKNRKNSMRMIFTRRGRSPVSGFLISGRKRGTGDRGRWARQASEAGRRRAWVGAARHRVVGCAAGGEGRVLRCLAKGKGAGPGTTGGRAV
jgi:hypothetical protein